MSKINILFISSTLECGGAEKHLVTLLNNLSTDKFSLHAAYLKDNCSLINQIDKKRVSGILCLGSSKRFDGDAVRTLTGYIESYKIDIVVCVNTYPMLYAFLAKLISKRLFKIIDIFHSGKPVTIKQRAEMLFYHPFFRACDKVIYVSENQRKYWRSKNLNPKSDEVIYNGVDIDYFNRSFSYFDQSYYKEYYGFEHEDYVVGICAALRPEKAHIDMLKAILVLKRRELSVKCLFIGDGPERVNIKSVINEMRLHHDVKITGYKGDVRGAIAACDAMALVSRTEAFSIAALESMALSKPMIMSNVGGASEQIRHGVEGLLFESGDITGLANTIEGLIKSGNSKEMGNNARKRAVELFSQDKMIKSYEESFLSECPNVINSSNEVLIWQ